MKGDKVIFMLRISVIINSNEGISEESCNNR